MTTPYITARQDRFTLPASYMTLSQTLDALPTALLNAFVVEAGTNPQDEAYRRVATMNDISTLTTNPLLAFSTSGDYSFQGAQAGDVLVLTNKATVAPHWVTPLHASSPSVAPPYGTDTYLIAAVAGTPYQRLEISATVGNKPFGSATTGFLWKIMRGSTTIAQGSSGTTQRKFYGQSGDASVFLRPFWISTLATVDAAQNRVIAIDAGLRKLVEDSQIAQGVFDGYEQETY